MRKSWQLLVVTGALLSGCGSVAPVPPDVFLRLEIARPAAPARAPWSTGALRVAPLVASGLHKERALVYTRDDGNSLQQAQHQLWVDGPERLLQYEIARYLRHARVAQDVGTEYTPDTDLVVSGKVLRFEQVLQADRTQMSANLELAVRDPGRERSVYLKEYAVSETVTEPNATGAAQAMSRAVAAICEEFVRDVDAAIADPRQAGKRVP